jgi:hypothetical protein
MKLTSPGRRLAAGISLACAAVLLPTAALASSAGHAAPARAAAAACRHAGTEVWNAAQGDGAAGTVRWQIEISNIGHTTCSLFGYPGVSELNIHGRQVGLPARHSGAKILVTLRPGGTAHFVLDVTDAGAVCRHPVNGSTLQVFPPGQTAPQLLQFPDQMCPHRSTMLVDAVHPGTGIPHFSRH